MRPCIPRAAKAAPARDGHGSGRGFLHAGTYPGGLPLTPARPLAAWARTICLRRLAGNDAVGDLAGAGSRTLPRA